MVIEPTSRRYGKLEGAMLIGSTPNGTVGIGQWIWVEFRKGKCVESLHLTDPSVIGGRFEIMLPGQPDPERLVDLRAVTAQDSDLRSADVLEHLKAKRIVLSGDEAFFIRYTPEAMNVLADVLGL